MPIQQHEALTPLSAAILFALADGASHGYAIIKEIEDLTDGDMRPNTGSMYLALHRLLEEGLITESSGPGEDARRRYYRLSETGRAAAKAEARRMAQLVRVASAKKLIPGSAL
ncbi:MAG TPA: PadR family transcriptional regulator [Gemmatimonadaceae bacterium]|nr:PadR family transcriptional regulator [Gemmatimonadaceae bacterium]